MSPYQAIVFAALFGLSNAGCALHNPGWKADAGKPTVRAIDDNHVEVRWSKAMVYNPSCVDQYRVVFTDVMAKVGEYDIQ